MKRKTRAKIIDGAAAEERLTVATFGPSSRLRIFAVAWRMLQSRNPRTRLAALWWAQTKLGFTDIDTDIDLEDANSIAKGLESAMAQHLCREFLRVINEADIAALQDLTQDLTQEIDRNRPKDFKLYEPRRAAVLFWKDFLSKMATTITAEQLAYSLGHRGTDLSEIRRLAKKFGLPLAKSPNRGGRGNARKIFNGKILSYRS
jgi:hypothetical protein